MRLFWLVGSLAAVAAASIASPVAACLMPPLVQQPGETLTRAALRHGIEQQRDHWRRANAVYLGRVTGVDSPEGCVTTWGEPCQRSTISPVVSLSGQTPPRHIISDGETCSNLDAPVGDAVIVYAYRRDDREIRTEGERWTVIAAVRPVHIRDDRVILELRAAASRLRRNAQTAD